MRRVTMAAALAVVLATVAAAQFRRTLLVSDGDFGAFVERPFADALLVLAILALVVPVALSSARKIRGLGEED